MFIWLVAVKAHSGIEGNAFIGLVLRRISLNELVEKEDMWVRHLIKQEACILDIWKLQELDNESFCAIYGSFDIVGVNLLHLVYNRDGNSALQRRHFKLLS